MNREEKRAFIRKAKEKGINENTAKLYMAMSDSSISLPISISEDDNVMLDIEKIKSGKDYQRMSDKYKEFVDNNTDTVFTAHVERGSLISMKEDPAWLFWSGDLKLVDD